MTFIKIHSLNLEVDLGLLEVSSLWVEVQPSILALLEEIGPREQKKTRMFLMIGNM